jgi:hypothetical protein
VLHILHQSHHLGPSRLRSEKQPRMYQHTCR